MIKFGYYIFLRGTPLEVWSLLDINPPHLLWSAKMGMGMVLRKILGQCLSS